MQEAASTYFVGRVDVRFGEAQRLVIATVVNTEGHDHVGDGGA
jgi:hypothetical protein